jgi:lipopolysaccharide biosynthesis glycosyltransferase
MNIYSSVDSGNLDKIIILFYSCYINANKKRRDELKFYILSDNNILPELPDELKGKVFIKKLDLDERWEIIKDQFNKHFYNNISWCKHDMNFGRFLFFKTFPEVERVIYLDWDMIVQGDIFELEEYYYKKDKLIVAESGDRSVLLSIFDKLFYNKSRYLELFHKKNNFTQIKKILSNTSFNINELKKVRNFNAGFFIISKEHWKEDDLIELLTELILIQKNNQCFNYATQVVMNLQNLDNRLFISKVWNHLPDHKNKNIKIIHWNGKKKAWKEKNDNNLIWWEYSNKLYPDKYKNIIKKNDKPEKIKRVNKDVLKKLMV